MLAAALWPNRSYGAGPAVFGRIEVLPITTTMSGLRSSIAVARPSDRVFRVSYRVQVAGVVSLLAVPVILAVIAWVLVLISPWLAVGVGALFVIGVQVAIARRWSSFARADSVHLPPGVQTIVERLCAAGELTEPKIVLHDRPYANSWTNGLTQAHTTLHLTTRLVELLGERQLQAVIAHELSHIGQKDARLMSAVGAPVAALLDGAGAYFHLPIAAWQGTAWVPKLRRIGTRSGASADATPEKISINDRVERALFASNGSGAMLWLAMLPFGLLFLIVGSVSRAITAVFSRARELEADAGAARLTGNPSALASALIALSDSRVDTIPLVDLRRAASLDAFHIVAIGKERPLVHTHPSLKRRLKQLSDIETRLQHPHR